MALQVQNNTLSARTTRYTETKVLIQKIYDLKPDDPAMLGSLCWVNFQRGNLDEAEQLLRQVLELFPEAKRVAACLDKILSASSKQCEAKQI